MRSAVGEQLDRDLLRLAADGELDLISISFLASLDPMGLDHADRVELIRGWERASAVVEGHKQHALAAVVDATVAVGLDGDVARHEVGAALGLSPVTAAKRTRVASTLRDRLPGTLELLVAGEICYRKATTLAEAVRELPQGLATRVEGRVLARAAGQTVAEFKRSVQRAVLAVDPASAAERHERAVAERTIERMPQPDGMGSLWVTMPAGQTAQVWSELTTRAQAAKAACAEAGLQAPGIDALRVDALVAAILGPTTQPDPSDPASQSAPRPTPVPRCRCGGAQVAAVVLDLPTALGLADNPGELPGHGPVSGRLARELAVERDWVRWTTDPGTRQVIDRGATIYRPSDRLRAFVAARDRRCGFPGCGQPAQVCDLDHVTAFDCEGPTVCSNLVPLCRQHHNAKTHGRWILTYRPDTATRTWTSPLGRRYTTGTDPPLP
jgi:hypothetical protein